MQVLKVDDTRYVDANLIALTNNGQLYLFNSLKLTLAGQEVEHVNYPGHATHHFLVWRYIHQITKEDVDWHKVDSKILVLLQILILILDSKHDRGT